MNIMRSILLLFLAVLSTACAHTVEKPSSSCNQLEVSGIQQLLCSSDLRGHLTYQDTQDTIALARLEERNADGPRGFTDLYLLARVGDQWKIVDKVSSSDESGPTDQKREEEDVGRMIALYVKGLRTGDVRLLESAFSSHRREAGIYGRLNQRSFNGGTSTFYAYVKRHPMPSLQARIAKMQVQGSVAMVRLELVANKKLEKAKQEYTQMLTLSKNDGRWEISGGAIYTYPKSREGSIAVDGGTVWYKVFYSEKTAKKAPLIVLNGGPGAAHNYMLPLKKLAEEVRPVVFYDQLGSGASVIDPRYAQDPTPLWTIDRFVRELGQVIHGLGYERAHLLGHSWGTTLAFEYYKRHKEKVLSLILQGAFFSGKAWDADAQAWLAQMQEPDRSDLRECAESADPGIWQTPKCEKADDVYSHLHLNRQDPWAEDMNDGPINFDPKYPYLVMNGPNEFHASGALGTYEAVDQLHLIQVPTLFISGQYDEVPISTAMKYARAIDPELKGVQVKELPNCSHLCQLEQTDRYLKLVSEFLR